MPAKLRDTIFQVTGVRDDERPLIVSVIHGHNVQEDGPSGYAICMQGFPSPVTIVVQYSSPGTIRAYALQASHIYHMPDNSIGCILDYLRECGYFFPVCNRWKDVSQ